MKVDATIVIYNQYASESKSCFWSVKQDFKIIFLLDNSTNDDILSANREYSIKEGLVYLDMLGNTGLAKAYNLAKSKSDADYMLLLDDDSIIDDDFYDTAKADLIDNPAIDILLPRVYDNKGLLSPCHIHGCKCSRILGNVRMKDSITGINSGMIISKTMYDVNHDEGLFLDWIDHMFIRSAREQGAVINLSKAALHQEFSGSTDNSVSDDYNRFEIYKKDTKTFAELIGRKLSGKFWSMVRGIKLSIKHRNMIFLKGNDE